MKKWGEAISFPVLGDQANGNNLDIGNYFQTMGRKQSGPSRFSARCFVCDGPGLFSNLINQKVMSALDCCANAELIQYKTIKF